MSPSLKSQTLRIFISIVAFAAIFFIFRDKIPHTIEILRSGISWKFIVFGFFSYLTAIGLLALRLQIILKAQNEHLSWWKLFQFSWVGLFFNFFLPSAVGGDIAKGYFIYKTTGNKITASTAVLIDRLMGFFAVMLIALIGILVSHQEVNPGILIFILTFILILALLVTFFLNKTLAEKLVCFKKLVGEKIAKALADIYQAFHQYKHHPKEVALAIGLSIVLQLIIILQTFFVVYSLGDFISFWILLVLMPLITIASMAPSLGGLGVREMGSVYFLKAYVSEERALAISILCDLIIYSVGLIGGIIFLFNKNLRMNDAEKNS